MALVCIPLASQAQQAETPSIEQMVQQLKAPKTRSLRNLVIEAAAPEGAASAEAPGAASVARPSLSLLIQFDFNSARVRPESQQALANLSEALQSKELALARFSIEGHTDAKGSADYNKRLSQQRAQAVKELLASRGIGEARLSAQGKGASEPANAADPFAAENRRVRIVNLD